MNSSPLNDLAGLISGMALKDRIQELLDAGFKKGVLAKAAGKSPAAVTHWLNGETKEIKADSAAGLQALTGFSSVWISEGKGPKRVALNGQSIAGQNQPLAVESIASGATNINVNRQAPQSAHDVATALVGLMARVEPGHRDAVASLLSSLARNPADPLLTEMLVKILDPAAFTQPEQRTG